MSQYLSFILKHKNAVEQVYLTYFETSITRSITRDDIFPYTEDKIVLNETLFDTYVHRIGDDREEILEYLQAGKERYEDLKDLISKCNTREAMEVILEELNQAKLGLEEYETDIEKYDNVLTQLAYVKNAWKCNPEWDLFYSNF